jgi:hypothetical protein
VVTAAWERICTPPCSSSDSPPQSRGPRTPAQPRRSPRPTSASPTSRAGMCQRRRAPAKQRVDCPGDSNRYALVQRETSNTRQRASVETWVSGPAATFPSSSRPRNGRHREQTHPSTDRDNHRNHALSRGSAEADARTRTGDPFITSECQACHGSSWKYTRGHESPASMPVRDVLQCPAGTPVLDLVDVQWTSERPGVTCPLQAIALIRRLTPSDAWLPGSAAERPSAQQRRRHLPKSYPPSAEVVSAICR